MQCNAMAALPSLNGPKAETWEFGWSLCHKLTIIPSRDLSEFPVGCVYACLSEPRSVTLALVSLLVMIRNLQILGPPRSLPHFLSFPFLPFPSLPSIPSFLRSLSSGLLCSATVVSSSHRLISYDLIGIIT